MAGDARFPCFMVRKDADVSSVNELDGATICVDKGTTNELNLADYFRAMAAYRASTGQDPSLLFSGDEKN